MASDLPSATILTDPEIVFNDDAAAAAGQTNPPPKQRFGFAEVFRQLAAGTVGGIACTVVGYPFDTFKVRMQMGSSFRDIARSLTWRTLFAGVAAPIYGAMPAWAAGYAGYNIGKHIVALAGGGPSSDTETSGRGPVRVSTLEIFIGGFTSGVLGSIVRGPTDVVKVNCQNQGISTMTYLRQLIGSEKGLLRSLSRGMVPTLMHTVPTNTVFFGSYDIYYNVVFADQEGFVRPLLAGGLAGVSEWAIAYPFDTFKTRFQASAVPSVGQCWRDLFAEAGGSWTRSVVILYRGITPTLLRAFPANSCALAAIEGTRELLGRLSGSG